MTAPAGYGYGKCQKLRLEPVKVGPSYRVQRLEFRAISASADLHAKILLQAFNLQLKSSQQNIQIARLVWHFFLRSVEKVVVNSTVKSISQG